MAGSSSSAVGAGISASERSFEMSMRATRRLALVAAVVGWIGTHPIPGRADGFDECNTDCSVGSVCCMVPGFPWSCDDYCKGKDPGCNLGNTAQFEGSCTAHDTGHTGTQCQCSHVGGGF